MSSPPQKPDTLASLRGSRTRPRQTDLAFNTPTQQTSEQPRQILTVTGLVSTIRRQVERAHADLWVEGEISNCRLAPSGHIYFTLKDAQSQLPVVLFRREAQLLRFRPADGLAVLVRGRISVYEPRGQLQLIADTLEPLGAGSLQLAFAQLKARLLAEGLFDVARKRPLPAFPRCVGVITSPTGAVIRDIVTVVRRRHAPLNLLIHPAVMQGPTSPSSVARAIRWFNANPQHADLILVARGGGSLEDLAAFNDEALARIIASSKLPIVSAIGHETDFTIADFVADLRAPTPSAAAELITTQQHRIEDRVAQLDQSLRRAIRLHLLETRQRYERLSVPAVLARVSAAINRRAQRIDELAHRADRATHRRTRLLATRLAQLDTRLRRHDPILRIAEARVSHQRATARLLHLSAQVTATRRHRLAATSARLEALSPLNVLARGYALVYNEQGTLLRNAAETTPGQTITARLAQGSLTAQITASHQPVNDSEKRNK